MNANLLDISRTLFHLFVADWTPERTGTSSRLPENWRVSKLEECCVRIANGRTPSRKQSRYWNGTIPWLTSSEVRKAVITETETSITREGLVESSMKVWPQGTTVVAMVGATAGCTALLAIDACANQACCGIVSRHELRNYIFLYMQAYSMVLQRFVLGSAQQNLNQQAIAKFPILVPDNAALTAFDERVRPLLERVAHNLRESETLRSVHSTLLPLLFSGN